MIKWLKMKLFYYQLQKTFYESVSGENNVLAIFKNLQDALKDKTSDELVKVFLHELAGFAHEQAMKDRKKNTALDI